MFMAGGSTTSQSSGVTGGDLSALNEQEEISNLQELLEKEPMSSEWTDEKHSLYLKSIESLFVHQLYSSMESCGFHSHKKHPSHVRSSKQNESHAADQVHQHGCWQRIKFGRGEPPPQKSAKSRILLQNPWIQHFRSCDNEPIPDNICICQTIEDSSIGEEYSGQNFDEEDTGVRICSLHTTKRMKIVDAAAENHE